MIFILAIAILGWKGTSRFPWGSWSPRTPGMDICYIYSTLMISYNYHIYFMLIVGMNIHVHALFHVIKFNLLLKSLCIISMEKKSGYFFFIMGKSECYSTWMEVKWIFWYNISQNIQKTLFLKCSVYSTHVFFTLLNHSFIHLRWQVFRIIYLNS